MTHSVMMSNLHFKVINICWAMLIPGVIYIFAYYAEHRNVIPEAVSFQSRYWENTKYVLVKEKAIGTSY